MTASTRTVGQNTASKSFGAVALIDPATGLAYSAGAGSAPATGAGTAAAAARVTYASDGATIPVAPVASELLIGQTGTPGDVIVITPTLDTSAYVTGDILFNPTTIANAVRINGGRAIIQSLTLYDGDDQGLSMDIFLCSGNTTFGTINTAPSISDANLVANQPHLLCTVATTDWIDLGGIRVATPTIKNVLAEAGAASRDLYLVGIIRGSGTYTASGLTAVLGFVQL